MRLLKCIDWFISIDVLMNIYGVNLVDIDNVIFNDIYCYFLY